MTAASSHFSLSKAEILRSKKDISLLFESRDGLIKSGLIILGLRYVQRLAPGPPVKVLFVVPKRMLRKAHQRNLIKRRLREAFRLNKSMVRQPEDDSTELHLSILYRSSKLGSFHQLQADLTNAIQRLPKSESFLS